MGLELSLAIKGDLGKTMQQLVAAEAAGVTSVIRRRTTALKKTLRKQIVSAGLGERLANAMRSQVVPTKGTAPDAMGRVFSKALVKGRGGISDLVTVFEEGRVIRARGHALLAIPTPAAGRRGRRGTRSTPSDFPRGALVLIQNARGTLLLVDRDDPGTVLFLLVPQVRIRKRLNVKAAAQKATSGLDAAVAKDIERRMAKIGFAPVAAAA
jgi:hypothetical protein